MPATGAQASGYTPTQSQFSKTKKNLFEGMGSTQASQQTQGSSLFGGQAQP